MFAEQVTAFHDDWVLLQFVFLHMKIYSLNWVANTIEQDSHFIDITVIVLSPLDFLDIFVEVKDEEDSWCRETVQGALM